MNPPSCIRAELEALRMIEFVHRSHQALVRSLNEIHQWNAFIDVFLCDADSQFQVAMAEIFICLFVACPYLSDKQNLLLMRQNGILTDIVHIVEVSRFGIFIQGGHSCTSPTATKHAIIAPEHVRGVILEYATITSVKYI